MAFNPPIPELQVLLLDCAPPYHIYYLACNKLFGLYETKTLIDISLGCRLVSRLLLFFNAIHALVIKRNRGRSDSRSPL